MVADLVVEVGLGVYLGILAGIFPAVVAFALGFGFKYLTGVSIPGLGVVVLAGALAGISGGLLGLLDETVAQSSAGMAAFLVVLMLSLWAHGQGDKLGATVPRYISFSQLHRTGFSAEFLDRVDSYGQIRIKPVGSVEDIEGFPPLSDGTREAIRSSTWKFPADLSAAELETKLAEKLVSEHNLSEVVVAIDPNGLAEISAAPETAGLSRRIPAGKRAVSIETLLPTGMATGDRVSLSLPDGSVTGEVVSATSGTGEAPRAPATDEDSPQTDGGAVETAEAPARSPTTDGGKGSVTVALSPGDARRTVREGFAKLTVQSRGKGREYETLDILQQGDSKLQLVTVARDGRFDGATLSELAPREEFGVGILAIRRKTERIVGPRGSVVLAGDDELIVAGTGPAITAFREAMA
jgi:hypothetical protein